MSKGSGMDALSDVLRVVRLTGGVFLHAEFSAPWCIAARVAPEHCAPFLAPASNLIIYHYVVEGELRLRVEGDAGDVLALEAGEVVLLPRNDLHLIGCDHAGANPVISTLPAVLKLDLKKGGAGQWVRSTFQYAAEEVAAGRPGSETVLAKVSELLFVETVRRYAESLPDGQTGWLAGLRDTYVARALALMHHDIARPWTVDELGREVGLSRSALADRFIRLIGTPPMHYLASWRMQVAMQELRNTSASLAQLADMIGYESEAAFSRAFKKAVGTAPATWRRSRG